MMNFEKKDNTKFKTILIFTILGIFISLILFNTVKKEALEDKAPINSFYLKIIYGTLPLVNRDNREDENHNKKFSLRQVLSGIVGVNSKNSLDIIGREMSYVKAEENNQKGIKKINEEHILNEFTLNDDQVYEECNDVKNDGNMNSAPAFNPSLKKKLPSKPEVLIYHTHTCEGYKPYGISVVDQSKNVVAVGEEIKKNLNKYGINVIHDNTIHDIKTYKKSYQKSRVTLKKYLKQYGDFKLIIDLHRDSITNKKMVTTTINGESVARFGFVMTRKNPHSEKNIRVAESLKNISNKLYQGDKTNKSFCKGTFYYNYGTQFYSQDLSNNAILIEMGSHINTLNEAKGSGKYLARIIAEYIRHIQINN